MSGAVLRNFIAYAIVAVTVLVLSDAASYTEAYALSDDKYDQVLTLGSITDLRTEIAEHTSKDRILFRLAENEDGYEIRKTLTIRSNEALDLNGQTVSTTIRYPFVLNGEDVSVTNGTIDGGGVKVISEMDEKGSVTDLMINDASEFGIYVSGETGEISNNIITRPVSSGIFLKRGRAAGNIENNSIKDGGYIGIRLFGGASSGDIKGNTVTNCDYHAISLNGSSKAETNNGAAAGDIIDNTIRNCRGDGISVYHGSRCGRISDNVLSNIGGHDTETNGDFGIIINNGCDHSTYAEEITHNTVSNVTFASIVVFSGPTADPDMKWQNKGYVKGDIAYNKVTNSSLAKKGIDWGKEKEAACESAIYVDAHAGIMGDIHHNEINTSYDNGICVLWYSSVNSIVDNVVNKTGNAGISVTGHSKVYGTISRNRVKNSTRHGMFINNSSAVNGPVAGNVITQPRLNGIQVSRGARLGTVSGNTIYKAGHYGVMAGSKGTIEQLSDNTVSTSNAKGSIGIYSKTGCFIRNIKGNSVKGKYKCGIRVRNPVSQITVASNTVSTGNPGSKESIGIEAQGCRTRKIRIRYNSIRGNKSAPGIYIYRSSAILRGNRIRRSAPRVSVGKSAYKVRH